MSQNSPMIILRTNHELQLRSGDSGFGIVKSIGGDTKIKLMDVSDDGKYLAYADTGNTVKVVTLPQFETIFEKTNIVVNHLKLSPKSTVLVLWHHITQNVQNDNLLFYNVLDGTLMSSLTERKQSRWCPKWSRDESVCVRHVSMELQFFHDNRFDNYTNKLYSQKVCDYSMVTHRVSGKHYIACYSTGNKGQPNFVRIYQYPNLEGLGIANKSFYKADSVTFMWNHKGDALLLLCTFDVDQSGKSYYGEQSLHYLDIKGDTCIVKLNKDGPIHNTQWIPSLKESIFCVIYGFMPANAALFNAKADVVFQFGESMVNQISFNPFGNILALAGFGNLRGEIHIWDLKTRKVISHFKAPESTNIEWSPDGMHIMTATTSPRLRVGNGFRIWFYNGSMIHEEIFGVNTEMYDIVWQSSDSFPEPIIKALPVIKTIARPAEPAKYIPPHLRKSTPQSATPKPKKSDPQSEHEKKIRNLQKKLEQIEKLKAELSSGKQLEKNQIEKINKEDEIVDELTNLQLNL